MREEGEGEQCKAYRPPVECRLYLGQLCLVALRRPEPTGRPDGVPLYKGLNLSILWLPDEMLHMLPDTPQTSAAVH